MRTFGVEEELLLVDGVTGEPRALARQLLRRHGGSEAPELTTELQQEMLEIVTSPHDTLAGLRREIAAGRALADSAAVAVGARAVALARSPLAGQPHPTVKERYQTMVDRYGILARNSLSCGFHVHVSIESPMEGVAVLDRIRGWLPVILALSANSPFSDGEDTGYMSFRRMAWSQWPSAGPTEVFGSEGAYRAFERELLATDVLLDAGMLYLDARLARLHPTVEIRIADVCLRQEDAVTIAAIVRALVETAAREWRSGVAPSAASASALRLASWKSALCGLSDELVHPVTGRPSPAGEVVVDLLDHVGAALAQSGDEVAVAEGIGRMLAEGTGADWQRRAFRDTGSLRDVVAAAVSATHAGGPGAPLAYDGRTTATHRETT